VTTSGAIDELDGVSCNSASACMAVGPSPSGGAPPLAERWNGLSWSTKRTALPAGATGAVLYGVSCVSATACTAVGSYPTASGSESLVEQWNGTGWSVQTPPNPPGASFSELRSVSCSSASACTAVGDSWVSPGARAPLAEQWNGITWSPQTLEPPPAGAGTILEGVSCTSAGVCTTVGSPEIAESEAGTTWSIQPTPAPTGATTTNLTGVSCPAASICTAVGAYGPAPAASGGTLALRYS
jgi:hypothetical protein